MVLLDGWGSPCSFINALTSTVIASITIPLALLGTFAVVCLLGYTLDNLPIMGLSIAVGLASLQHGVAPVTINHQGLFPAITLSFNLAPGAALGDAVTAIHAATAAIGMPDTVTGSFQGTAQAFQDSLRTQPWLILAAILTVYVVLGVLYESPIHPLTIISTLPSAALGGAAGAQARRAGPRHPGHDRHHPVDRYRQEERDHDRRLRAGGAAPPGSHATGGDLPGSRGGCDRS